MTARSQPLPFVYVGIASSVVALDKDRGEVAWSTRLRKTTALVSLLVEGGRIDAVASGEISCLDALTGEVLWHNELKGYGRGWAILGGAGQDVQGSAAATAAQAQAAQSAAVATMIATTAATSAAH